MKTALATPVVSPECQLERQRRVKPQTAARLKAGGRVVTPRFGVDPDVCTGDKSCMRFNGCPSLTLKDNPDPLREDPVAHVDQTCVGCGLCGGSRMPPSSARLSSRLAWCTIPAAGSARSMPRAAG